MAAPAQSARDFYRPPAAYSATPGSVIRTESAPLTLQIPGVPGQWPGTAQRIMYTSTLQDGAPTAVTGYFVEPTAPWTGRGPRPTVVLGPGTIGQGDQCAGSKLMAMPFAIDPAKPSLALNYAALEMNLLLLNGVRVAVTDYIGMGTPGIHTYVNRLETGHAMIDAARAALRIAGVPADSPVGFTGYSQGGGAAASAAELAPTYAPELNVKAAYAGAPPVDLHRVIEAIDGTLIAGAIGYAINGLAARYPELQPILERETGPDGRRALQKLSTQCLADTAAAYGFQRTTSWTRDGVSLSDVIARNPAAAALVDDQRIGTLKPTAPVLLATGVNDDALPADQVIQLYRDWRRQGADVRLQRSYLPPIFPGLIVNHVLPMLEFVVPGTEFLLTEFNR